MAKRPGTDVVITRTNPMQKHKGVNPFLVRTLSKGSSTGSKEDKLGFRSSDTSVVVSQDVEVSKANRPASYVLSVSQATKTLDSCRIGILAQASGVVAKAYDLLVKYEEERSSFAKPNNRHQVVSLKFEDMAMEMEVTGVLVSEQHGSKTKNKTIRKAAAMTTLYTSKGAKKSTVEAVQIHGGYGFVKECHVERLMEDAKITRIYEDISEIQRIVILRNVSNESGQIPFSF